MSLFQYNFFLFRQNSKIKSYYSFFASAASKMITFIFIRRLDILIPAEVQNIPMDLFQRT